MIKRIAISLIGIFFLLQLFPVDRSTASEEAPVFASEPVLTILRKSCYDCHSDQTKWPLYSYVFPISLFLKNHIDEGKEEINFSKWEKLSPKQKATAADSIIEEIEERNMPLFSYTLLHNEAKLSDKEIQILKDWAEKINAAYEEEP